MSSFLSVWLPGGSPARSITRATLRRSSGISRRVRACTRSRCRGPGSGARRTTSPVGVEALHADVVEVAGPVHGGARVRLGEHQQSRLARERAQPRAAARRSSPTTRLAGGSRRTPRPERGTIAQLVLAVAVDELVVAVAEEGEVVVGEPARGRRAPSAISSARERAARASRARSTTSSMRARIGCQSSNAARTSASTCAMPVAELAASFAGSVSRSTSTWISDSRRAFASPAGAERRRARRSASRRTREDRVDQRCSV